MFYLYKYKLSVEILKISLQDIRNDSTHCFMFLACSRSGISWTPFFNIPGIYLIEERIVTEMSPIKTIP
jgi:hypothetical protein